MRRRPAYRNRNFLDFVPVRKSDVRQEVDREGRVTLIRPRAGSRLLVLLTRLLNKSRDLRFSLDGTGTAVWSSIDGRRTIAELTAGAGTAGAEPVTESDYIRCADFVRSLQRRGLITLVYPCRD
ncbi:PqqD family protein [bacterium]|nr:PqqD family protein [bacterium]